MRKQILNLVVIETCSNKGYEKTGSKTHIQKVPNKKQAQALEEPAFF